MKRHLRVTAWAAAVVAMLLLPFAAQARRARTMPSDHGVLACQALPADVVAGDGLYIGELHGTQQVPALVLCLTKQALRQRTGPIVVSLEQFPDNTPGWLFDWTHPSDGRTSLAMSGVIADLRVLARQNPRLTIDYQMGCPILSPPADFDVFDNNCMGVNLGIAMKKGFLIAYSGNTHAGRQETPFRTAAAYLPATVKTVNVVSSVGGTAWGTYSGAAPGIATLQPNVTLPGSRGFTTGQEPGFDYDYVIGKITASAPANKVP